MSRYDNLTNEQYGLLFDVRRSVRYHDRRRSFYEQCHHVTNVLTILMSGSVLFDLAKDGKTAWWLILMGVFAALFAAADMVIGYAKQAGIHAALRERFAELEIKMLSGSADESVWLDYQRERLFIEKDEPPIYKALDGLCRNELLIAEGYSKRENPEDFAEVGFFEKLTSNLYQWPNLDVTRGHSEVKAA